MTVYKKLLSPKHGIGLIRCCAWLGLDENFVSMCQKTTAAAFLTTNLTYLLPNWHSGFERIYTVLYSL